MMMTMPTPCEVTEANRPEHPAGGATFGAAVDV
jgi:hypothetical protein